MGGTETVEFDCFVFDSGNQYRVVKTDRYFDNCFMSADHSTKRDQPFILAHELAHILLPNVNHNSKLFNLLLDPTKNLGQYTLPPRVPRHVADLFKNLKNYSGH